MSRFLILFKTTAKASDLMTNATHSALKTSVEEWINWKESLDNTIGFEWGMPLQIVGEVRDLVIEKGASSISGYAIMEGDKNTILEVLKTHPQLKRPDASIEVLEMLSMPGLET